MPIALLFALGFLILAAAAGGGAWYFSMIVLPGIAVVTNLAPVIIDLYIVTGVVLLIAAAFFLVSARSITRPLKALADAIDAFAAKGKEAPFVIPPGTPKEIQRLARSFLGLVAGVETAHKRDLEVSRVKSDFITTAAHQLRTPLTGIRWALEALEKSDHMSEDQETLVKSASDKSRELVAIVSTLLDISAIESGKYHYQFAPLDLVALSGEVLRDFTPLATERKVTLVFAPLESPVPPVRADRERVKWIFNNLVENAIRYTPEGGAVTVSVTPVGGNVLARVRDTGIGIEPSDRANIFERFYRAPNAVSKENAGNGLGLYIARTIAKDHGGDLDFSSNAEGPGTTFTLTMPMGGPAAP